MNISFRLATEHDLDTIDDILVAAYKFAGSRKKMLSTYYLPIQTAGWWLVVADGKPVGFGGAVNYQTFSSVGMLCISPEWQNKGLGEKLVQQILLWEKEHGRFSMVLEANARAASLYARLGFLEEDRTLLMILEKIPTNIPCLKGVVPMRQEDLPALAAFDADFFGGDRLNVLQSHFQAHPETVFATHDEAGHITGYLFARPGVLGPWVATNADDAERLLTSALSLPFEQLPGLSIPTSNEEGVALLRRYAFRERGQNVFMRYGADYPGQRQMIYAQASPALG